MMDLSRNEPTGMCFYWKAQDKCSSEEELTVPTLHGNTTMTAKKCLTHAPWRAKASRHRWMSNCCQNECDTCGVTNDASCQGHNDSH